MKRVVDVLLAPLRLIFRSASLLAAMLLLLGAWGLAAFFLTSQVARDALNSLTVSASAVAASVDVPLEHFADTTDSFRAVDLQGTERVALTARLLRLQSALPPMSSTFALGPSGQLLGASSPFAPGDASVTETVWFHRAIAGTSMPLTLQRVEGWLRPGPSIMLTKVVRDSSGKLAGVVGALLRVEDFGRMTGHTWFERGVFVELRDQTGELIEAGPDAAATHQVEADEDGMDWGLRLMSVVHRLFGVPSELSVSAPLRTADVTVMARMDTDLALRSHWLGNRAIAVLGAYLLAVWLACVALLLFAPSNRKIGSPAPTGFGSDWQVDLDKRGCIVAAHGFAPDRLREAIDQPLLTALGLARADHTGRAILGALDARSRQDVQVTISSENGQERLYRLSIEPLPDGKFVCQGRDLTNEIRLATELDASAATSQAVQQEAAAIRRDRDRVLAALGHDVRTPMNSIMGICSLLLDSELEQEQRIWLQRIRASCEALLAMLNGLLEIASGEVGGLQMDEVDVIGLIQEVADTLQPQARDKGLELKTRYDDLLRGYWRVDPTRFRQLLFNLVGNAIKFTASGQVEIRASAVAGEAGVTLIKVAVSDTGPGIAPEDRDIIFDRFKRGRDQENSGHPGLGLGLALCRENAVLMGGALTVESAVGVGSEFTFEFPAERISQAARNQPFRGRTALLVGDEDTSGRTIASQLADAGMMVETAPDGYLGLALAERIEAQRGALDLVIMQGSMIGMPAGIFLRRLRATAFGKRTTVIWLGDGAEGEEVDAVVARRVEPYQVASLAQQLLAQRSPFDALEPTALAARGGRILIVEDDKINQALLLAALTRRGFSAFVANDGDEAVRLASRDNFDAILMDIQMPHRDGFEATRKVRSLPGRVSTIPIIALTGLKGAVIRKRCADAGFTAVLEKPVNFDHLGATLRRWLPGGASAQGESLAAAEPDEQATSWEAEYSADVSQVFLEEMLAVIGIERTRACVADFVADASARCMRLGELLPGWEAAAVIRLCEEISGLAETCGAIGLGEVLEEIADAVTRNARSHAEALVERLEKVTARLGPAMVACLEDIERRWKGRDSRAA